MTTTEKATQRGFSHTTANLSETSRAINESYDIFLFNLSNLIWRPCLMRSFCG